MPVVVQDLPPGYELQKVEPPEVVATVSGPRRALLLSRRDDFELDVDAILVRLGRRNFEVDPSDVKHPTGITVLTVQPERIVLSLREPAGGSGVTGVSGPMRP